MDQITIKTPNPKCRLYWCFIEFADWRFCQSCWYFRPPLWNSVPLTFSWLTSPPPLLPVWINTGVCNYTVCNGGGGNGIRLCGEHLHESYTLCIWPPKLLYHPKQKPRGGGGQINTCRQIPLQVNFEEKTTLRVWCLFSYLDHAHDGHIEGENNGYIVFKWNTHGVDGKYGFSWWGGVTLPAPTPFYITGFWTDI